MRTVRLCRGKLRAVILDVQCGHNPAQQWWKRDGSEHETRVQGRWRGARAPGRAQSAEPERAQLQGRAWPVVDVNSADRSSRVQAALQACGRSRA
jgi:hypothetical protein